MAVIREPARDTEVLGEYEVVVAGGGPAGIAAATAAARAGRSVILIERYGYLGGAGTAGGLSTFCGLHARVHGTHRQVIHGIADDILDRIRALDGLSEPHLSLGDKVMAQAFDISAYKIAADAVVTEAGATPLYHALVTGVSLSEDGAIEAVFTESKSGRHAIRGRVFIDCSGDGDVAAWSGAAYEKAPELLFPSLMFRIAGVNPERAGAAWKTVATLMDEASEAGTHTFPRKRPIVRPQRHPAEWRANMTQLSNPDGSPVDGTDVWQLTHGELTGRRQILSAFSFIRERTPGFEDAYIVDIAPQVGIRETRRIVGPYQVSESDVLDCVTFPDSIGLNGWPVEAHVAGDVAIRFHRFARGVNDLPFRMIIPRGVPNLYVAGRCASMTQGGQSAARVSGPCFAMGQAAGTAADLALKAGVPCPGVDYTQLRERLLADGAQLGVLPMTELRSNLPEGTSRWAVRRAQWLSMGISDEDMVKPKIAIVNSSSDLASCFAHLDGIVGPLKASIREAGGLPFEVRTAAPSDFITSAGRDGRYILPARDLIAADIEVAVEGAQLDGMVCLASCDKTVPGQLMAAARLNIPSIVIPCGYQACGVYQGSPFDIEEVFLQAGHAAAGRVTPAELAAMSSSAIRGPGVCAGMGTANSMALLCEALGLALPGTTPVAANSSAMWEAVSRAGSRIVDMVLSGGPLPRDVLTEDAFANGVTVMLAVSGSVNTMKHLRAIAAEARVDVDIWSLFERLAPAVPLITAIRPNGEHRIEDLDAAGGTSAILRQLGSLIRGAAGTVSGETIGAIASGAVVRDPAVIRPASDPFASHPTIRVLRGSLGGGVIKLAVSDERPRRFSGPARVYDSRDSALAGLRNGEIQPGEVVCLAGIGLRGGPGMGLTSAFIFALDGAGLGSSCAVITDGQMSGLVNTGIVVGEVFPEAAVGGPLGLVRNGDRITVDLDRHSLDLEVPAPELTRRRAAFTPPAPSGEGGWLAVYERTVGDLPDGATLATD